jgi:hypothetical protein
MDLTERLSKIEARLKSVEEDRDRFLNALRGAAEMCLGNPMVSALIPKDMKNDLRAYLEKPAPRI